MQKLKEIEESLKKLHLEFNEQVVTLSNDTKEFHNSLIELVAKYPEHRELIQFIVFINDKLETNQTIFSEVIVEAFNDLVNSKRELVQEVMITKQQKPSCKEKLTKAFKAIDLKIVAGTIIVVVLTIGVLVDDTFVEKAEHLVSIISGKV